VVAALDAVQHTQDSLNSAIEAGDEATVVKLTTERDQQQVIFEESKSDAEDAQADAKAESVTAAVLKILASSHVKNGSQAMRLPTLCMVINTPFSLIASGSSRRVAEAALKSDLKLTAGDCNIQLGTHSGGSLVTISGANTRSRSQQLRAFQTTSRSIFRHKTPLTALGKMLHMDVVVMLVALDDGLVEGKFKPVPPKTIDLSPKHETKVTINMDMTFVQANKKTFTDAFAIDVAGSCDCMPEQVHVTSITAGSVIIGFVVDGVADPAAKVSNMVKRGMKQLTDLNGKTVAVGLVENLSLPLVVETSGKLLQDAAASLQATALQRNNRMQADHMTSNSAAVVQQQQTDRESEDAKSVETTQAIVASESDNPEDTELQTIEALTLIAENAVHGNETVLVDLSLRREGDKLSLKILDDGNWDMRKQMAQSASTHDWKTYWNLNMSLSQQLVKRNVYHSHLRRVDNNIGVARHNVSRAKAGLAAASNAMKKYRAHAAGVHHEHDIENSNRMQNTLLKRAHDESVNIRDAQSELTLLLSAVPRDDWNQDKYHAWQQATAARQLILSKLINNAQVRAASVQSQAGQLS